MTTLKCQNCGGTVELNSELPVAFCPYCGAKSLIDEKNLGRVYTEKEKTRRLNLRLNHDRKMQELKDSSYLIRVILFLLAMLVLGIFVRCS